MNVCIIGMHVCMYVCMYVCGLGLRLWISVVFVLTVCVTFDIIPLLLSELTSEEWMALARVERSICSG